MTEFIVTATGTEGCEYVYRVWADHEGEAVENAYGTHGLALICGRLDEPLTPWHHVEEA